MKKNILSILLIGLLVIGLTGCGKKDDKTDKSDNNEKQVGKLDLEVEDISDFSDGLARIKIDGKYGYIDKKGNIIVEPQYRSAGTFNEGLAPVCTGDSYSNQKCGYITIGNKIAIEFKYNDAKDFSSGYAVVKVGSYYGVINQVGEYVITPDKYKANIVVVSGNINAAMFFVDAQFTSKTGYYDIIEGTDKVLVSGIIDAGIYSDSLIRVKNKDSKKWGFADSKGNMVIDYQYDMVGNFVDGIAGVVKDGKIGYIDKNNEYIIEPKYTYSSITTISDYSCGLVRGYGSDSNKFFDKTGKEVFSVSYSKVGSFVEDRAMFKDNDKYGFIDKNGKKVIDNKYESVSNFSDGLALVKTDKESFEFIDSDGKTILGGKIKDKVSYTSSSKNNTTETSKESDKKDSTSNSNSNNDSTNSTSSSGIKVGNYTIKYGTYKGDAAVSGETLVIKSDGTATLNGEKFTYKVGKHDFAQDSSSSAVEDCLILEGNYTNYYYVTNNGKTLSQGSGMDYIYSGN